jgi:ADP-heptose:LPS heptosyltransferase
MADRGGGPDLVPRIVSRFVRTMGKPHSFELPGGIANARSILFIDSGDIVDLLFAAPVVNCFAGRFPNARTTVLVRAADSELVKALMRVSAIVSYEAKQLKIYAADYISLARKLRAKGFDAVMLIDRHFSIERHLLAFASGAPVRIGFAHPLAFPFVNCEIRIGERGYEGKKLPRILQALGLGLEAGWDDVALVPREVQHARQLKHFWKPERDLLMVGLDPSSGKTRHHVIPEIIAYLANNLASRRRAKFVLFSNPEDEKLLRSLAQDLRGEILDLRPANLTETVALLSQCDLFISGNTNLFHFAAAFRVPTIGLFTKYDRQGWVPEGAPRVRILSGVRGEKLSLKEFFSKVEEVLEHHELVAPRD